MKELNKKRKKAKLKIGKTVMTIIVENIKFKRGELYSLDTLLRCGNIWNEICDNDNKDLVCQPNYGISCVLSNGEKISDILWHIENVGITEEILQIIDKMVDKGNVDIDDGDSVLILRDFTINVIDNTSLTFDGE